MKGTAVPNLPTPVCLHGMIWGELYLYRDLVVILLIHVKKLNILSDYTSVTPKVNTDCVILLIL
jgi:hypothetical protein